MKIDQITRLFHFPPFFSDKLIYTVTLCFLSSSYDGSKKKMAQKPHGVRPTIQIAKNEPSSQPWCPARIDILADNIIHLVLI